MSNTSKIFQKHFGNTGVVSMNHPKMKDFFEELNQDVLKEDFENQYKIIIHGPNDVPPVWINWNEEKGKFVVYNFTGKFVQLKNKWK